MRLSRTVPRPFGTPTASGEGAWRFALGYGVLRLILVLQYLRAWRHVPDARRAIKPYLYAHSVSGALWLISAVVPYPAGYWLWGLGIALEFAAPPVAGKGGADAPLHMEHLPERFALFVILVLGESVTAVVTGLQVSKWDRGSVLAALPAFIIAVALWWMYFDISGAAAKRRLQREGPQSRFDVHDRFLFAHLPLAGGLVAIGVGLEHAITDTAGEASSTGTRWTLIAGLVLYLSAAWALQALTDHWRSGMLWPGLAIPAVVGTGYLVSGTLVLVLLALILVTGVIIGLARRETGDLPTAEV